MEISALTECELKQFSGAFRAGAQSPLACLPRARPFSLSPTTSKRLLRRLDKYGPLRTKSVANRKRVPWFNHKIKDAIQDRRRAERKWRYSKSAQDPSVFKKKKNHE